PDDDVLAAGVEEDLRRRRPRFLVGVLPVDQRGEAVARIGLDALPHVEDRAAGRVDQDAADLAEAPEVVDRDPEGGEDDDVIRRDDAEVEATLPVGVEEGDPHLPHALVHVRVVDDLADQEDPLVRELVCGLVGVVDGAIDAVAEAELLGEADGDVAELRGVAACAQLVDDRAVVFGRDDRLDHLLQAEAAPKVGLLHVTAYDHAARGARSREWSAGCSVAGRARWMPSPGPMVGKTEGRIKAVRPARPRVGVGKRPGWARERARPARPRVGVSMEPKGGASWRDTIPAGASQCCGWSWG